MAVVVAEVAEVAARKVGSWAGVRVKGVLKGWAAEVEVLGFVVARGEGEVERVRSRVGWRRRMRVDGRWRCGIGRCRGEEIEEGGWK